MGIISSLQEAASGARLESRLIHHLLAGRLDDTLAAHSLAAPYSDASVAAF